MMRAMLSNQQIAATVLDRIDLVGMLSEMGIPISDVVQIDTGNAIDLQSPQEEAEPGGPVPMKGGATAREAADPRPREGTGQERQGRGGRRRTDEGEARQGSREVASIEKRIRCRASDAETLK